jgi:hypothetical protein
VSRMARLFIVEVDDGFTRGFLRTRRYWWEILLATCCNGSTLKVNDRPDHRLMHNHPITLSIGCPYRHLRGSHLHSGPILTDGHLFLFIKYLQNRLTILRNNQMILFHIIVQMFQHFHKGKILYIFLFKILLKTHNLSTMLGFPTN